MNNFAAKIGSILGRLVGILVMKGVLTDRDREYILEGLEDEDV